MDIKYNKNNILMAIEGINNTHKDSQLDTKSGCTVVGARIHREKILFPLNLWRF